MTSNSMTSNSMTPNPMTPNPMTPNPMTPNPVTPAAATGAASAASAAQIAPGMPWTTPGLDTELDTERAAALVARAEAAVRLSGTDPRVALAEARAVLAETAGEPCPEAASVALRASALAARELGDLDLAGERLRQAIAAGVGWPRRVAQARMSLVTVQAHLGDPEGGLRLADLAEQDLSGRDLARLGVQRSVALMLLGRHREAVRHCDDAIGRLDGDPKFQAGGLLNRGLARVFLEQYGLAQADLSACAELAREAGLGHLAMLAEGNLPFVAARRGDIPAAFVSYHAAEAALSGYPERLAAMRTDFAEALLAARLPGEARAIVEQAVPDLVAAGAHAALPEARLLLAQAALLVGDGHEAAATAETALAELHAQGRSSWAPLAREILLRARTLHEEPDHELLTELLACASELAGHGWTTVSGSLRLTCASLAARLGDHGTARAQLDTLIGSPVRAVVRHHARAMRLHLDGDHFGALAAAGVGLETVMPCDTPPGTTSPANNKAAGTAEPAMRAHAARPAEDLAAFGLKVALGSGDPCAVLAWAERWRAIVRGTPPPPAFTPRSLPVLDGTLIELVRDGDDLFGLCLTSWDCAIHPLGSYTAAVEAAVRIRYGMRRRNLRDAAEAGRPVRRPDAESGPAPGREPAREAGGEPRRGPGRAADRKAARGLDREFDHELDREVARELELLDRRLLGPLDLDDGPVVVVPTGPLCTLPWPLFPLLRGRPVSIAPEGSSWLAKGREITRSTAWRAKHEPAWASPYEMATHPYRASYGTDARVGGEPYRPPLVMAVAGPGLDQAGPEASMVVRTHPNAERITATRAGVLAALERADVLHVAAHGTFSPHSPMLSQITMNDGPIMAYELRKLRRMPNLVILSACDAGMAHAPVDGAVLGLAGAFLDGGCACVIAGISPVRDDEAATLMTVFHAFLADGRPPAEALGAAIAKTGVGGFVCFGAGQEPVNAGKAARGAAQPADVERGRDARHRQGEHLVRGRHPGSAVGPDLDPLDHAERVEPLTQEAARTEPAARLDVLGGGGADRAGDVARHRVHGLDLPAVALARPGVEQHPAVGEGGGLVGIEDRHATGNRLEVAGGHGAGVLYDGQARLRPGPQASVEHPDVGVAEIAQRPPRPGRRGGVGVVVDHHGA
jgi:tetratricopeptide (TPR) repeat protein